MGALLGLWNAMGSGCWQFKLRGLWVEVGVSSHLFQVMIAQSETRVSLEVDHDVASGLGPSSPKAFLTTWQGQAWVHRALPACSSQEGVS